MKYRCSDKRYVNYHGKGIKVCPEWANSFEEFAAWSMCNGYDDSLTIDRMDNDGNYTPENCRWTTKNVQARNTRKISKSNSSGYRNVVFDKYCNKWKAYIKVNGVKKHIGRYHTPEDAAMAYDQYVIKNNLEHTLNFGKAQQ